MEMIQRPIGVHHVNISDWKFMSSSWANVCSLSAFAEALWLTAKPMTMTGTLSGQRQLLSVRTHQWCPSWARHWSTPCLQGLKPSSFQPPSLLLTTSHWWEQAAVLHDQGLQRLLMDFLRASLQRAWLILIFFRAWPMVFMFSAGCGSSFYFSHSWCIRASKTQSRSQGPVAISSLDFTRHLGTQYN